MFILRPRILKTMSEKDFFNIKSANQIPEKGILLISPPLMADGIFHKSVILLLEHSKEGSMGFIINKQTNLTLADVINETPEFKEATFFGGPVSPNQLQVLHKRSSIPESINIYDGIYWGGDFKLLFDLINKHKINAHDIKFYLGYAGWSPGQLEEEIDKGSWLMVPAENYDFWESGPSLWETVVKDLGMNPKIVETVPDDPRYN